MTSIKELTEIGKELGYTGTELRDFITQEQARERDRRREEREAKQEREEREHERKLKEKELVQERERERQEREHECKMREKEMEHRMALELEEARSHHRDIKVETPSLKIKVPKLPYFDENKDNMDSYLSRFERYAEAQKLDREMWSIHLNTFLKGKALDIYSRLSKESAFDYDTLKTSLLKRFELTEEGFRQRFHTCKPERGESFIQFITRSRSYLEKWFQLGKVEMTLEGVMDFLIRDQLLSVCQRELYLFLKAKGILRSEEMAIQADLYAESRGGSHCVVLKDTSGLKKSFYNTENQSKIQKGTNILKCFHCSGNHRSIDCRRRGGQKIVAGVEAADNSCGTFGTDRFSRVNRGEEKPFRGNNFRGRGRDFHRGSGRGDRGQGRGGKPDFQINLVEDYVGGYSARSPIKNEFPTQKGQVNSTEVTVLRDTGANCVVVKASLVEASQFTGNEKTVRLVDGSKHQCREAQIEVDTPYYTGRVFANVMDNPLYDLVLGNIEGVKGPDEIGTLISDEMVQAVQTRAQVKKESQPVRKLKVPEAILNISRDEFRQLQKEDPTLQPVHLKAQGGVEKQCKAKGKVKFVYKNDLLYRQYTYPDSRVVSQIVVPKKCRESVLRMAHESLMAGHLGLRKTSDRVTYEFYWPGVMADTTRFCRSCDICQRTTPKGRVSRVPLGDMPLIDVPFKRVAVDIVGPIDPVTENKNRYILVMVDYATRYPEAIALPSIETERVANALIDMYSRLGIPEEMLTDMGSQFTSDLMKEVSRLLSLRQITTTPYHPMCNGLVEKFNGTLKQMLKKMCAERPRDWDKYLNAVLFAFREVPQESLGFSPFELLYGRKVRGPATILKELWSGEVADTDVKTTYQYVLDLQEKLQETCRLAQENLTRAKAHQKRHFNKRSKRRIFIKGDKVLILLPVSNNKLLLQWKGPYTIEDELGNDLDYKVKMGNKVKTFHANMLKKYYERGQEKGNDAVRGIMSVVGACVVEEEESENLEPDGEVEMANPTSLGKETVADVNICKDLSSEQTQQVRKVLEDFSDVLTDLPGTTTLIEHDIKLTTTDRVRTKGYPIPFHMQKTVDEEVQKMLDLKVIEHSDASYSSPIVLVKKKDGSIRFCIDFRALNRVTVFDSETMPNVDEMFSKLSKYRYFSELDLSKGYWQVPMAESAKDLTSFQTSQGLFRFRKMPFGLVCACATFCRMMRIVLKGLGCADSFVDNVLVFSMTFEDHLRDIRSVLARLRASGLTARPTKCNVGFTTIECLGFRLGGSLMPVQAKVEAVQRAERPTTKKQVRSFLGLVGFYRKFIPNFSAITVPLTDLTKKGQPNSVIWTEAQEKAFNTLKGMLVGPPILMLPDLDKPFILRTDASDVGLGAVLLQESEGEKRPVAYASKKLLDREKNYAVIEKECLAVVWGVSKFHRYLYGKKFILETDHQPLTYLNRSKTANSRLMRWALMLQPYNMIIQAIPGRENIGADYLSRL